MGLPGIHLCNDFYMSYWLLFAYLPYDHLIVPSDAFFSNEWFRSMLFVFGFYPQEHGMTPDNFKEFDSRMDVYLDQGFSFWQPVFFEYRETDALPYAVVMALKHQLPIHIWKFNDVDGLDFVHWLNRRRIQLTLVEEVAISRRVALTISAFSGPIRSTCFWIGASPSMAGSSKIQTASLRMSRVSLRSISGVAITKSSIITTAMSKAARSSP